MTPLMRRIDLEGAFRLPSGPVFEGCHHARVVIMVERTLSIVKPDAVRKGQIGEVLRRFEQTRFAVIALQMRTLTQQEAEAFYHVHRQAPFFGSLTAFMSSGPLVALVLEAENVIARNRVLMGATDPKKADRGTLRADLGGSIEENVVHGSDSAASAAFEIPFFFSHL